mmetsp:Transcript_16598/g.23320  ORF Transcript_16598/g.23320 Transcript_16598/m.23320 type:complete len:239 (+) Transcript_16598:288-1004(+)
MNVYRVLFPFLEPFFFPPFLPFPPPLRLNTRHINEIFACDKFMILTNFCLFNSSCSLCLFSSIFAFFSALSTSHRSWNLTNTSLSAPLCSVSLSKSAVSSPWSFSYLPSQSAASLSRLSFCCCKKPAVLSWTRVSRATASLVFSMFLRYDDSSLFRILSMVSLAASAVSFSYFRLNEVTFFSFLSSAVNSRISLSLDSMATPKPSRSALNSISRFFRDSRVFSWASSVWFNSLCCSIR